LIDVVIANENLHAASSSNCTYCEFGRQQGADKGHALSVKGADVTDQNGNVHRLQAALSARFP
jgi:hypothetical protein